MTYFNRFLKVVLFFLSFPLMVSLSQGKELIGQVDGRDCFSIQWPHEQSTLDPDPGLIFGKLENGFRYVLLQNTEPKNRVALYLKVQAGSMHEEAHERGYAHFLEHMLFNGSTHFKPGDLVEYFQSIGMDFGADINAYTTFNETVYNIFLPEGGVESIKKGFLVMMDYSRGAHLLESEVVRERGVILAEKLARDSVSYRTRLAVRKNALRGTLLAERNPIGLVETLNTADGESLRAFYDHWYRPEKMILVVVGDFNKEVVEPLLKQTFSALKGEGDFPQCPDVGKLELNGVEAFYHPEPENGTVSVSLESYWNKREENDSFEYQVNQIKEYAATRILQKRLERMIEEGGGGFTRSNVYTGAMVDRIGYSGLSVQTDEKNWMKSLRTIEQSLRQALIYGVQKWEVDLVKEEISSYFTTSVLTAETRKTSALAKQIVRSLNEQRVFQSPLQEKALYLPELMKLKVSDINTNLRELWSHDSRLLEVTGNVVIATPNPEKTIIDVYQTSLGESVADTTEVKRTVFPYLSIPESSVKPVALEYHEEIDTDVLRYKNGLVLNLKKTEYEKNRVHVALHFGLGKKSEPVPGLSRLAESVVAASGTGALLLSDLKDVLAGSSINFDFEVNDQSFSVKGSSTGNETERLLEVVYTLFMDPAMREAVYHNKMKSYEQMYLRLKGDIHGSDALYAARFLAGGNSLFGLPSWEEFSRLKLSQIREWLEPAFHQEPLEISIVGDFDKTVVVNNINRYFGTLPHRTATKISHTAITFPKGKHLDIETHSSIEKALLKLVWQTTDYTDIGRTRRLSMLAGILEDRVRIAIRERLGASYSPATYNVSSRFIPDYGTLTVSMILEPANIEVAKAEVLKICTDLLESGVSSKELVRTKEPRLTHIKDRVRNNNYWLHTVLSLSSVFPEQLKWPTTILADNEAITAEELTDYARQYLRVEDVASVVIRPVQ